MIYKVYRLIDQEISTDPDAPLRLLKQSDLLQKSSNTMEVFKHHGTVLVVEASAGTGKTFALEELVLELALVERIPLQKILLVTFTEKATQELRTRLRSRLREIVDAAQSGKEWLGQEGSGSLGNRCPRLEQLKAALLDFDAVPIYTIHGFCNRLLREFAFENRLLFDQQQANTRELMENRFRLFCGPGCFLRILPMPFDAPLSGPCRRKPGNTEERTASIDAPAGRLIPEWPPFSDVMQTIQSLLEDLRNLDRRWRKTPGITQCVRLSG